MLNRLASRKDVDMNSSADPAANPDRWYGLEELAGRRTRLEPLRIEHAPDYLAALGTREQAEQVFQWLGRPAPATLEQARGEIFSALAARFRGERLPYAQLDLETGELIGTTSFYEVTPAARTLAIGHTWLGTRWWRTGHNIDSKRILLAHAFDTLGAARVVWHTDLLNLRSQRAIEGLGAVREGVLRKHRIRSDGSWRDSVQFAMTDDQWPQVSTLLADRLRPRGSEHL
jgi:RimJ/RimL family protein N-acetyltransferase